MGAKIGVLLNCGQQSQFSKVRREFDAGRVNLDPPMTCADWPVPGNLTLLHTQTAYTRKPLHRSYVSHIASFPVTVGYKIVRNVHVCDGTCQVENALCVSVCLCVSVFPRQLQHDVQILRDSLSETSGYTKSANSMEYQSFNLTKGSRVIDEPEPTLTDKLNYVSRAQCIK